MTDDKIKAAERAVMEADVDYKWFFSTRSAWYRMKDHGPVFATDNDVIAAAYRWLLLHGKGEWTRWMSNGLEVWRGDRHIIVKDMTPKDRLLAAVAECMEGQVVIEEEG